MAIEAPLSKFRRNNLLIYIAFCIALVIWCGYDGYLNEEWINEHTNPDGKPETDLVINRAAPPFLLGAAVLLAAYLIVIKNRKLIADESELIISGKQRIPYDSIQRIDKTKFKSKGYFIITYKDEDGTERDCKIGDRKYDNLAPVLDHLVGKIT